MTGLGGWPEGTPRLHVGGTAALDLTLKVARLPRPGETVSGDLIARGPGGKALNYALAARRLGASVALLASVGQDEAGEELLTVLAQAGVETWGVQQLPGVPTALSLIAVDPAGENMILTVLGAASTYQLPFLAQRSVPSALIVQAEWPTEALRACLEPGMPPVILNLAPYRDLPGDLLARCDTLILNEQEAAALVSAGLDDLERLERSVRARVGPRPMVIVTLGARGAMVMSSEPLRQMETLSVDAVDTSGAGDSFVATYAVMRALSMPIRDCMRAALAASSLTVQRHGTAASFPTWEEVHGQLGRCSR